MVIAAPQAQWRLLDVQAHDTRLAQLAHRAATLPEHAQVSALSARLQQAGDAAVTARTAVGDLRRELKRAEADVELVRQRSARNQGRLDAGQGSSKDLQALQHEIESLTQRQSVLEDVELDVMERLELAEALVAEREAQQRELEAQLAEVTRRRDAQLVSIEDDVTLEQHARADAAAGLPADLAALYEKVKGQAGGIGAAKIKGRRCEGCHMELSPTDLARIRDAPQDAVVRCEECRRILIRTPDSGL